MRWVTANCDTRINLELASSCTPKYLVDSLDVKLIGVTPNLSEEWLHSVKGSVDEARIEEVMRKETGKSQSDLWWPGKSIQSYAVHISSRIYFFDKDPTLEDSI